MVKYVLVHGLGLSANIWDRLIPLLDGNVIAIDLPGHGKSSDTDYSWDGIWANISRHVGSDDRGRTVVVLHSFSAAILPEVVAAGKHADVVTLEGILHPNDAIWTNDLNVLDEHQYNTWLPRFRSVADMTLKSQLINNYSKAEIQFWSNSFRIVKGAALRAMARNLLVRLGTEQISNSMNSAQFKITSIRGQRTRLSMAGRLLLESHSVPVLETENCGHFPMLDNPYQLAKQLCSIASI